MIQNELLLCEGGDLFFRTSLVNTSSSGLVDLDHFTQRCQCYGVYLLAVKIVERSIYFKI